MSTKGNEEKKTKPNKYTAEPSFAHTPEAK